MATMPVFVGSDAWNADVYGTLAFASRLAAAIKTRRFEYRLAYCFWRLNNQLDSFFSEIYSIMEKAQSGTLPAPAEPIDPAKIQASIKQLHDMHLLLDGIHTAAKLGLTNHSILKIGIAKLHHNDERVVELAGWLSDTLNPQELEKVFADALEEYERGETVTLPG